jgi:hypothetical protein
LIRLNTLSYQVMLDRLVARRHYYLGIQISRHLQLSEIDGESRILAHWACYKVCNYVDLIIYKKIIKNEIHENE